MENILVNAGRRGIAAAALAAVLVHAPAVSARDHGRFDHHHGHEREFRPPHHNYGYRVHALPRAYVSLNFGGGSLFYSSGYFYRAAGPEFVYIRPPIGVVVPYLPVGYTVVSFGAGRYYHYNDVYYSWDRSRAGYVVVSPQDQQAPPEAAIPVNTSSFAYPRQGQSEDRTARDKYECYLWAVDQTGYDPSRSSQPPGSDAADYIRANTACLEGRGYSVR